MPGTPIELPPANYFTQNSSLLLHPGSSFAAKLNDIWKNHVIREGESIASLYGEVEKIVSSAEKEGLTLKQALYSIAVHLTCAMLLILNQSSEKTSHHYSYRDHLKSCGKLSNIEEIKSILEEVFESFETFSKNYSKTTLVNDVVCPKSLCSDATSSDKTVYESDRAVLHESKKETAPKDLDDKFVTINNVTVN
ncbi:unnamed protein product [Clavelina lepadiformis]|uniref:Uncharacterized protein n=1 Tax=Clavelina lepadiformis TaxID=159417 RepID=A0ABP0G6X8_CLALP